MWVYQRGSISQRYNSQGPDVYQEFGIELPGFFIDGQYTIQILPHRGLVVGWFSRSYGQKKKTATESSSQWKWPRKKDPQTDHHLNSGLNSAAFLRPPPCPPETQGPHPKDTKTSSTLRIFTLCPLTLENRNWPRQGLPDIYIYIRANLAFIAFKKVTKIVLSHTRWFILIRK